MAAERDRSVFEELADVARGGVYVNGGCRERARPEGRRLTGRA